MNYCDKIRYSIYSTGLADFGEMVGALLAQVSQDEQILRLAFFGKPTDNSQYVTRRILLREKVRKYYGNHEPVLSYVSQPPLNAGLILEVHSYKAEESDCLTFRYYAGFPYVVLENADGRFLFAGGFHGDILNFNIQQQASDIFGMVGELMRKEGFPLNSIIRQWNYIEGITCFDGADQHYQMFNNARADFYAKAKWPNGYPAATGIGANLGGVVVDLDVAMFARPECCATPIDNKLQVAAHAYSDHVLETAHQKKSTPKFERAKSMTFDNRRIVYISGTAAIRGEESLEGIGLERQLHITMENIGQLIENAQLKMLRVYLKEKTFYEEASRLLDGYQLGIPISYMWADVCRDELLIEIEGIAIE